MNSFEENILSKLPNKYANADSLIHDIAIVHSEFLLIHPFREGNGRTARLLANLMVRKQGYGALNFNDVGEKEFKLYVEAVQSSATQKYIKMEKFIKSIFPS